MLKLLFTKCVEEIKLLRAKNNAFA